MDPQSDDILFPELSTVVAYDRHEESLMLTRDRRLIFQKIQLTHDVATQREILALFLIYM